ncbi:MULTISPECIES: hypothetical protein [Lysobacter]|uniref:Uncharacterized protein n=1 Tax=Lysobacter gummosus TaxID=262324 RepID=A0ABY3X601_9GAMM|nr:MULTISPECIES: hypothetical protein [Lysobacter]ALN92408.1 hypothetical protein LG3211_3462 [Lysobacter gummosus]UJB20692.1 hypothetical protein L1A79_06345 [Lysobacter capsici]UJQ30194.1 hypothetical protein L2D09_08515 [Lysobacter gummosus]UNP27991.1 hypothetical protein MOV92_15980 [Lysobacter gummosus]
MNAIHPFHRVVAVAARQPGPGEVPAGKAARPAHGRAGGALPRRSQYQPTFPGLRRQDRAGPQRSV